MGRKALEEASGQDLDILISGLGDFIEDGLDLFDSTVDG